MTQHIDEVKGIDAGFREDLCRTAAKTIEYQRITPSSIVPAVARHHALLFCFPIAQIPCKQYVSGFLGERVVTIGNDSCVPAPEVEMSGFSISCVERFPSKLTDATMTVYVREMPISNCATAL